MKPYGLPVDQYILYLSSRHGKRFLMGDTTVAICTDCHSSHRVLEPEDPRSEVNKKRITETCGRCHADTSLMKKYGVNSKVIEEYRKGVHGKALEEGNTRAPGCTNCHGSHGAIPSGFSDINKVCGICHPKEREFFQKSPHYAAMKREKIPECEACHGNHFIQSLTPVEGIEGTCKNCHGEDSESISLANKLKTLFVSSLKAIEEARKAIEEAKILDVDIEYLEEKLEKAKLYYTEAVPILHSFDLELVEAELRKCRSEAEDIVAEVHKHKLHKRERIFILIAIWFYILLTLVAVYQYRRRLRTSETG
jgi:hypothetical protein